MSSQVPRVRMFAGPNGSGKSTLKGVLPPALLGRYVNADDIERRLRADRQIDLSEWASGATPQAAIDHLRAAALLQDRANRGEFDRLGGSGGVLDLSSINIDSYVAATVCDFLRERLLAAKASFTFETVMSHPSKIDLLRRARDVGYRTYLYFVATEDVEINVARVRNRVSQGGHGVPEDKIRSRYTRSLDLLFDALRNVDRAYLFDNSADISGGSRSWIAERTDQGELIIKVDSPPAWFTRFVEAKLRMP